MREMAGIVTQREEIAQETQKTTTCAVNKSYA